MRYTHLERIIRTILRIDNNAPALNQQLLDEAIDMSKEETPPPEVAITDRRGSDRRKRPDRRQRDVRVAVERRAGSERRTGERRRQVDPTTCERDYTDDEIEFMQAMDQYKRANRRPFPTWSEVLEVVCALGYRRVEERTVLPGLPLKG